MEEPRVPGTLQMGGAGPLLHIHSWEQQTKSPSVSQKTCVSGFVRVTDRRLHRLSGHKASVWIPGPQTPPSACKWEGKSIKQSFRIFPWSFGNVGETPCREKNQDCSSAHFFKMFCLFMHLIISCVEGHTCGGQRAVCWGQLLFSHCVGPQDGAWRPGWTTGFITLEPYFFFFKFEIGSHSS